MKALTNLRTADAIRHFKGTGKLANALGISHAAVSQWGEFVPEGRAYQLQLLTGGELKAVTVTLEERGRNVRKSP